MPYAADAYDDTKPVGSTLAMYTDEELRAIKSVLKDHRDRVVLLEDTEATTTQVGRVRLANAAELAAGVDTLHPIAVAQLVARAHSSVLGAQWKFNIGPNMSVRLGIATMNPSGADTVVVFDTPFTGTCKGVLLQGHNAVPGVNGIAVNYTAESAAGFTIQSTSLPWVPEMFWVAFGSEV